MGDDRPGQKTHNTFALAIPTPVNDSLSELTRVFKNGPGRWILSGDSTYQGQTRISAGSLRITSNNALGTAGSNTRNWTVVVDGAALELEGGITVPESFHFNGTGPVADQKGGLRSVSGDNTLTGTFALDSDSSIGVDTDSLRTTGLIYQDAQPTHFALTKIGDGTLNLNGLVQIDTLNTNAGTTNLNNSLLTVSGAPGSTLNANATTNISVSQTLAALNIADDVVVTLGPIAMSPPFEADGVSDPSFGAPGDLVAAVPEPGLVALLFAGAFGLAARRRRAA